MERQRHPRIHVAWWLVLIRWILVSYVKISPEWVEKVREAANAGPVVFVLRNRSLIDFLCLQGLMRRHGLPEVGYVAGLSPFSFFPLLHRFLALIFPISREAANARLTTTLALGGAAVVFLRRPALRGAFGSRPVKEDGIKMAVSAQGMNGGRLLALPTVFLWGESAMQRMPGAMDFLFGSNEYPRVLRAIWLLLIRRSVHEVQVGAPLDVAAIRRERGLDDDALSSVVRAGVGKQIELIRRAKLGALTKPSSRIMTEVHKSGRLMGQLRDIAKSTGIPESEIRQRAWAIIKKLAADFRPRVVGIFGRVMTIIWKRIYTGIDIRKADIEKMRAVMGERATLLLPSHKSHIDYLVLSQVMKENNLMMPHIAAGQNLAFWPLGWLFRSSGAFFIRRKFVDDRFYTAVVSAYIRRLIHERYAIEVFIEGGRSRTGKLLRPRTGLLDMALKAVALFPATDLNILPIFIGYEHVIEEQAYVSESGGRPKRAENLTGLIRTTTILFHKFGRLHVRVGRPFTVSKVLFDHRLPQSALASDSTRRSVAAAVALLNLREINRITVVTSSAILATVLLARARNTLTHDTLTSRTQWLVTYLRADGAALSDTVEGWLSGDDHADGRLEKAIRVFVKTGRISPLKKLPVETYFVPETQRQFLDYYKNNIIHFLAPAALSCAVCLIADEPDRHRRRIEARLALLFLLYRQEFLLPFDDLETPTASDAATPLAAQTLDRLTERGIFRTDGDRIDIAAPDDARFLAEVLRNYHEVYFAALAAVRRKCLEGDDLPVRTRLKQITAQAFEEGLFTKPEGHSSLNQTAALETLKALRISRPDSDTAPFATGALGDRLHRCLKAILKHR